MLISVVIPVYNVEKYLRECLDSVINQTYKNLEIICVNDCSTDSSLEILEEYAKKDSRIVIKNNSENLGLGLTRNEGIKIARGDFIHCLDSDDWMNLNAYEILVKHIDSNKNPDVIRFRYLSVNQNDNIKLSENQIKQNYVSSFPENPECLNDWSTNAWSKLLSAKFIKDNNLYYNNYRCMEDVEYSVKTLLYAKNIYFIQDELINYRIDRGGRLSEKIPYYTDNIVKDILWTKNNISKLPKFAQERLLNYLFVFLIAYSLDAYYLNIINFSILKRQLLNTLDFQILEKYYKNENRYLFSIVNKLKLQNRFQFFMSYKFKRYLKEHFSILTKHYFKIIKGKNYVN